MIIKPKEVTEEVIRVCKVDDYWHFAQNINAVMKYGYCDKCHLVPLGCESEGCQKK